MSELKGFNQFFRLDGKVAIVTGGSRGLGLHCATGFLLAGAKLVIVTARKAGGPQGIDQAVEKLNALPNIVGKAVGIPANVAETEDIERLVQSTQDIIAKVCGPNKGLDILVANAGATWGGPFEPTPDWSSKKVLDLNVRGVFNLARLYTPLLTKYATQEDPSRIIVMSSVAGSNVPHVGDNGTIMYSASKAAAHHLARNLAMELGRRHVTTNTIAPGFFPSKLANGLIDILGGQEELDRQNPRGRLGVPEDVAGLAVFLCSPAGSYINGEDIALDGGARLSNGRHFKL
ncbi:NAD(P)-binding protein [Eremomyces bilateralis CBS 781.70]|uniref:NAD(P)-binding protein n=1 Tax=Eremomyces bilateralis CBS 781.70 TaxID=1392243 RepID=A0A6G1GAS7_9PEZI|nr:NAD(P)-binding protein [Eremomyces bilateralis CBS 781.70]KAF1814949.1 NAD(P)-binding protein [Eremomyces bilateralis CBS 781.70]